MLQLFKDFYIPKVVYVDILNVKSLKEAFPILLFNEYNTNLNILQIKMYTCKNYQDTKFKNVMIQRFYDKWTLHITL